VGIPRQSARRVRRALAVAWLALSLGATPGLAAGEVTVAMRSISYEPADITVPAGTIVTWRNVTSPSRVHDVVSSIERLFVSPMYGAGEEWSRTFRAGGTFTYICSIHDVMLGAVRVPLTGQVVTEAGATTMRIRLATRPLPSDSPFRFVVSRRDPGSDTFVRWRHTRAATLDFHPPAPGVYEFVMRVRNTTGSRPTGPGGDSPILSIESPG
jgi:plastocyanin